MCDPLSIASVALSGAGMAANSIAANQVQHATNAVEQQTQMLNSVQQQRIDQANAKAAGQYRHFETGQKATGQKLGDFLAANSVDRAAPTTGAPPMGASTSAALDMAMPAVTAFGRQQAGALGDLRSFGDYLAATNRKAQRNFETADQAGGFMKANTGIEALQLNDASHAGDTMGLVGSAATGLGGLGIRAGLSGGGGSKLSGMFGKIF